MLTFYQNSLFFLPSGPNPKKKNGGRNSQEVDYGGDDYDDEEDEIEYHPDYNPNLDDPLILPPTEPKLFPGADVGNPYDEGYDPDPGQAASAPGRSDIE